MVKKHIVLCSLRRRCHMHGPSLKSRSTTDMFVINQTFHFIMFRSSANNLISRPVKSSRYFFFFKFSFSR